MTYTRLARKTAVAWAAGSLGTPTAKAAYRVQDLTFDVEKANAIANNNFVGAYHPGPNRPGGKYAEFGFTSELRGSGTADVPPPEGALLRACGFSETASGTTPAIVWSYVLDDPHLYAGDPVGDLDPIDIDVNIDRLLHAATSCVGNVVLNFAAGQLATMGFSWRGVISGVGTEAAATAFTVGSTPVPVKASGLSVTVAGVTAPKTGLVVPSLTFDCGNILDPRDDINGAEGYSAPIITGRNPIITMVTEAPALATIDWEDVYQDHTSLDFAFSHNDGGGIRQELNVSFTAFLSQFPVLGELNGKMVYTLQLQPSVTSGATPLTLSWSAT